MATTFMPAAQGQRMHSFGPICHICHQLANMDMNTGQLVLGVQKLPHGFVYITNVH